MKELKSLMINYLVGSTLDNYYLPASGEPVAIVTKNHNRPNHIIYASDKTTKVVEVKDLDSLDLYYFKYSGGTWSYSKITNLSYHSKVSHTKDTVVYKYPDKKISKYPNSDLYRDRQSTYNVISAYPNSLFTQYGYINIAFTYKRGSFTAAKKMTVSIFDMYYGWPASKQSMMIDGKAKYFEPSRTKEEYSVLTGTTRRWGAQYRINRLKDSFTLEVRPEERTGFAISGLESSDVYITNNTVTITNNIKYPV